MNDTVGTVEDTVDNVTGGLLNAVGSPAVPNADAGSFVESLMDTNLYSIGAYFHDRHPELVDSVVDEAAAIERDGLQATRRPATSRSRPPSRRS